VAGGFDLSGALRRIRRRADVSQRQLAAAAGLSISAVAHAEAGSRDLSVGGLARAAALAGLRVALLDGDGQEVTGMAGNAVRDASGRRFPAHLDTRYGDEAWWHGTERYSRQQPWYTFDRERYVRDWYRSKDGTPDDHQLPQPGDSPEERTQARRRAARQRTQEAARRRRLESGEVRPPGDFECTCPPACDELDDRSGKPVHAPDCPCDCDVA
jgi:HTH-type transcriptional regulator/antitoxin HipB